VSFGPCSIVPDEFLKSGARSRANRRKSSLPFKFYCSAMQFLQLCLW
jgi:hypothetical protein